MIDDKSPPGSWQEEMSRMPWKWGNPGLIPANEALARLQQHNLYVEYKSLQAEIHYLQSQLFSARERLARYVEQGRTQKADLSGNQSPTRQD